MNINLKNDTKSDDIGIVRIDITSNIKSLIIPVTFLGNSSTRDINVELTESPDIKIVNTMKSTHDFTIIGVSVEPDILNQTFTTITIVQAAIRIIDTDGYSVSFFTKFLSVKYLQTA